MDVIGSVLSVAQTLSDALRCYELVEKLSVFGYEDELTDLQRTVEALTAVLRDAETKQELSHQAQEYIERVKNTIFEADDLVDEFVTLAQQQRLMDADGSFREKVSHFFSRSNPIYVSYWMCGGIKNIKKKLDAIASNNQFRFKIDPEPIRKRSRETDSYVNEVEIIGRKHDLESIVGTLLASNSDQRDVSVLSIVGIGGLGKTALAQLVYNHPRVTDAFSLRMWTCVSDQDQKQLDVKETLRKILASVTHSNPDQGTAMDQVQSQLREQLAGKTYLLVLDDVWTEKRDQWCELMKYLRGGERGSYIVVTTRSQQTATITGSQMHKLSGLSEESSWHLFERVANPPDELVMVGKKIVDGCSGVPLAIRVVGSLLYGQEASKWFSIQEIGLANIRDDNNGIMPILKLSFHHLESPLKNCFRYCSLFPKDHVIEKEMLINLWVAQGYIVPLDRCQNIEDVSEEYFAILLKRCFFQDIEKNEFGEIKSCKMHDLMHDIAQDVSRKEIYASDAMKSGYVDRNIRHLSIFNMSEFESYFSSFGKTHIRTLIFYHCQDNFQLAMEALVGKYRSLRVLDLSGKNIKHLPDSIGELLCLRYIDLSRNKVMEALPNLITTLCNLQSLLLNKCWALKELPKDMSRLVKLRVLDIKGCKKLTCMPKDMGKLTCLHTLKGDYHVGGGVRYTSWNQLLDGLENLKSLINIRGELEIRIRWPKDAKNDVKEDDSRREGLYLRSMKHLRKLKLIFDRKQLVTRKDEGMRVMEDLQPHSNLKSLFVWGYRGVKMPGWVSATLLPQLVNLTIQNCGGVEYLPCLGNFCHLKKLVLQNIRGLKYIQEEERTIMASTSTSAQQVSFFPSLEELRLFDLPMFEGWRRVGVGMEEPSNNSSSDNPHLQHLKCLSQLKRLEIVRCLQLTNILLCPMLETLRLEGFNVGLQIIGSTKTEERLSKAVIAENLVPKLRDVYIDKVGWLNSMPMESFHTLQTLTILDDEMEDLPNWIQHLSALQFLGIYNCPNLKAMPNWMTKLTSLKHLYVTYCSKRLYERCQKDPPGDDWPYIQHIPYNSFV